jgi:hypothetical protein
MGETPANKAKYSITMRFSNSRSTPLAFVLEPWGSIYQLPPGGMFELRLEGPVGVPHIESDDDAIVVYGWPGCVSALSHDGVRLDPEGAPPVPSVPPGMTMRDFIGMMFRGQRPERSNQD